MNKKGISLILFVTTLLMTTNLGINVKADPTLDDAKNQYEDAVKKVESVNDKVRKLDTEIIALMDKQDTTEKSISEKQGEIDKKQEEVEKAKDELQEDEDTFKKRVRASYKDGNDVVINLLVESKTIGDLIERTETIKDVSKREKLIMDEIKKEKVQLEGAKAKVEKEVVALNSLKGELKKQIEEINKQKEEQEVALAEAENVKNKYATEVKAMEDEVNAEANKLKESREQEATATIAQSNEVEESAQVLQPSQSTKPSQPTQSTQPIQSTVSTSTSVSAVLAEAERHLGKSYVLGANGPNTFDCSGFVQYVYKQCGVSLTRTTYTQVAGIGSYVAPGSEQPGDLVFFGPVSAPEHVGIYVGNGIFIHAPKPGDVVKYSKLSYMPNYTQARRILG